MGKALTGGLVNGEAVRPRSLASFMSFMCLSKPMYASACAVRAENEPNSGKRSQVTNWRTRSLNHLSLKPIHNRTHSKTLASFGRIKGFGKPRKAESDETPLSYAAIGFVWQI